MAKAKVKKAAPAVRQEVTISQVSPKGLFFELEYVPFRGRKTTFDVLKKKLAEKGIAFDKVIFSRFGLDVPLTQLLEVVVKQSGKTRLSVEKLAADLTDACSEAFGSEKMKLESPFGKAVKAIMAGGIKLGAVTQVDPGLAGRLVARLALENAEVRTVQYSTDTAAIQPNPWLRLTGMVSVPISSSVALVTSAAACRSALAARMRCIAITDEFTSCQDFGGADMILDEFTDASAARISDFLKAQK